MTDTFDPRSASAAIGSAMDFVHDTYQEVATLLRTLDSVVASEDNWESIHATAVYWQYSNRLHSPDRWFPRWFQRAWRLASTSTTPWIAVNIHLGSQETAPWIGCYLLEPRTDTDPSDWSSVHLLSPEEHFDLDWADDTHKAFGWSEPVSDETPYRLAGYEVPLVAVRSTEDVKTLVVEPLTSLVQEWNPEDLPALDQLWTRMEHPT